MVENAVATRMAGKRGSRIPALVTACVAAAGAGVTMYKLLRSSSGGDNPEQALLARGEAAWASVRE